MKRSQAQTSVGPAAKRSAPAFLLILCALFATVATASADDERVRVLEPGFGYWAPEMHELHVRLPLQAQAVGGKEEFSPAAVFVDGQRVRYALWYFDGVLFAYMPVGKASGRRIEVFVPLAWRAGTSYTVTLTYQYAGAAGEVACAVKAPGRGGVWATSDGGNYAFLIREEAGFARSHEPVDLDVTLEDGVFPDPERSVRATIMTEPGAFRQIPCQVYDVERSDLQTPYNTVPLSRFRAAIQLSLEPRQEALVVLWNCPGAQLRTPEPRVRMDGTPPGGTVENDFYRIELDQRCGLPKAWHDKRINVDLRYLERSGNPPFEYAINYTPDAYRVGSSWSHAMDWKTPNCQTLRGPVFCETALWGDMPGAPELASRVTYRFYADRPEVRLSSVIRVLQDVRVWGFRNGAMIQDPVLFTHAAWPRQDGSIVRIPIGQCVGNDGGAPPPGRMPSGTPWIAFYHAERKYGLAFITTNLSYFNTGPFHPNVSGSLRYVSLYGYRFLYTVRAMNLTYCANIRSYHTPMRAGTIAYEEAAMLPFTFEREDADQFSQVQSLRGEMLNPLVVVP